MNRRDFFKIVATTGATAAAAGCQQATEQILPLVVPNEQMIPGVASWFATVCRECPAGCGVLARNREGRTVKLEGSPDHPVSQGALCARGHAALQGLYHPDRFPGPQRREGDTLKAVTWDEALKAFADKLAGVKGKGKSLAVVTQLESGSLGVLLDRWTQALGGRPRVTLEPFGYEAIRAANKATFGRDAIPYYAIHDAEVVLSFGADFLETWLSNVHYARGFSRMHTFRDGKAGGRELDQCGGRQRREDRPLRSRLGLRQGHAVRRGGQAGAGDGGRRDRGPGARRRREPRVHAAGRPQGGGCHSQGAVRRQLREPAGRDDGPRARRAARHALAGELG